MKDKELILVWFLMLLSLILHNQLCLYLNLQNNPSLEDLKNDETAKALLNDVYIETILQTYPGLEFKDVKLGQYNVKLGEGVYNGRNVAVAISVGDNYLIYAEAGSNNEASLKEFFNGITVK